MAFKQQSIGRETAIKMANQCWWEAVTPRDAVMFQINTEELCIPFDTVRTLTGQVLGRPVYTHEFARPETLLEELQGDLRTAKKNKMKIDFVDWVGLKIKDDDERPRGEGIPAVVHLGAECKGSGSDRYKYVKGIHKSVALRAENAGLAILVESHTQWEGQRLKLAVYEAGRWRHKQIRDDDYRIVSVAI